MMAAKTRNDEPSSQDMVESKSRQPITSFERWQLTLAAALIPTVFIALFSFIWTINNKVGNEHCRNEGGRVAHRAGSGLTICMTRDSSGGSVPSNETFHVRRRFR